jgi:hypothetical protein
MHVRVEQKGPVAVYLFRRTRDDRITQELPAIVLPEAAPASSGAKSPETEPKGAVP